MPLDYNASDATHVAAKIGTRKRAEIMRREALRRLANMPEGRALILWLMDDLCRYSRESFDPNNPHLTSFNEGARSIGVALMDEIGKAGCAHAVITAQNEAERGLEAEALQVKSIKEASDG